MIEKQLLILIKKDPSLGINIALDTYGGAVKTICQSILRGYPPEEIEECVSDTFVGLWRNAGQVQLGSGHTLKSYLYGIARNTALERKRQLAKRGTTLDIDEIEKASEDNVEKEVITHVECEMLYEIINQMKSPDREIFIEKYYKQFTMVEIASHLGLTPKVVENRLIRGRARMKKQLNTLWEQEA